MSKRYVSTDLAPARAAAAFATARIAAAMQPEASGGDETADDGQRECPVLAPVAPAGKGHHR